MRPIPFPYQKWFVALCLAAWGVQHFLLGDFVAGRPPKWPEDMPGQLYVAYFSGLVLVATAVAMLANRAAKTMLIVSAGMILLFAAFRNLIVVIPALDYGGALTSLNKGLTIGFGCLFIAARFPGPPPAWLNKGAKVAPYAVGWFMLASGVQHFLFVDFVEYLVPAWIPGKTFWAYFAGVALIAGGLGLLTGLQKRLAAVLSGYMIFVWFLILHIPRAITNMDGNEWTAVFEALFTSALLFAIADKES